MNRKFKTGYLIDSIKPNMNHGTHNLLLGNYSVNFLEFIGSDVDLLILDTVHMLPGELLDFLAFLPFLAEKAVIFLHDIMLNHKFNRYENDFTITKLLYIVSKSNKYILKDKSLFDVNSGAIEFSKELINNSKDFFSLFSLNWGYSLTQNEFDLYYKHYLVYYPEEMSNLFKDAYKKHNYMMKKLYYKIYRIKVNSYSYNILELSILIKRKFIRFIWFFTGFFKV